MQRRKHRIPLAWTILIGVGGVMFLALSVALIIHGIMSAYLDLGALIPGVLVLPLALYLVAGALRPAALTIDDTGLHLHETFGSRHIPWDAVRAFRVASVGRRIQVQAILRTNKVIGMPADLTDTGPKAERIAAELTEALREHAESAEPPR